MKKILTVDDSPSMRTMINFTLANEGFSVTEAVDGQHALDIVRQQSFDLIISDVNMPKMNGLEFVGSARKVDHHQFTPILMLTTENSPQIKAQGKAAGATGWIVKPFQPEKLVDLVTRVLG